jgi:hypothetical protein
MDLTIDRDTWDRGRGTSFLRDSITGKQCCLGFLAKACGFTDKQITDVGTPAVLIHRAGTIDSEIYSRVIDSEIFSRLVVRDQRLESLGNTKICSDMMAINDGESKAASLREDRLIILFRQIGVDVTFEGKEKP